MECIISLLLCEPTIHLKHKQSPQNTIPQHLSCIDSNTDGELEEDSMHFLSIFRVFLEYFIWFQTPQKKKNVNKLE